MAEVEVIFGGKGEAKYTVDKPRMVVGRDPECEIHIDNLGVSRQHCAFESKGDSYIIQDLGSSNGTYVNGRKITQYFLNDADEIVIGKYTLRFRNAEQKSDAPVDREKGDVPDTMNTYVMDGGKIQEQLAKMRAGQGGGDGGATMANNTAGATAKDFAKAMEVPAADKGSAGQLALFRNLLIASMVGNIVLIILLLLILTGVVGGK